LPRSAALRFNRNWLATLPLPAYFGLVTVFYGVLTWGLDAIGHPRDATWAHLVLRVLLGSLFGAAMTGVIAFQRRRFGGSALMSATSTAIRTGRLPRDADPDTWTPVIRRRIRVMQRSRWLSPVLMAPVAAFGILAWVLAPATVVPAALLIGVALVVVALAEVQIARYMPRALAVLEELQSDRPSAAAFSEPSRDDLGRPGAVVAALIASVLAATGVAVSLAIFLFTPGDVDAAARSVSTHGDISLARAEQLAAIAVAVVTTYWSVLLIALVVLGSFAFRGRNWARALLVPTTLLTLLELIAHKPISIAVTAAAVTAVVLLYLPRSSAFFAARQADRRSNRSH
jgi:hypothetical protein